MAITNAWKLFAMDMKIFCYTQNGHAYAHMQYILSGILIATKNHTTITTEKGTWIQFPGLLL